MWSSSVLGALALLLIAGLASAQNYGGNQPEVCGWTSPQGYHFDLSSLRRARGAPEYTAQDPEGYFVINVCDVSYSSPQCMEQQGVMCEYRSGTQEFVAALARASTPQWSLIESNNPNIGVRVTYNNGDKCLRVLAEEGEMFELSRTTTFNFYCSQHLNPEVLEGITADENNCRTTVDFHTPAACPANAQGALQPGQQQGQFAPQQPTTQQPGTQLPGSRREPRIDRFGDRIERDEEQHTGWFWITIFLCVAVSYLGGGYVYNNYHTGAIGYEALPHTLFWRQLPGLVTDGIYFTYFQVMRIFFNMPAQPTINAGYNTIPQDNYTSI